MRRRSPACTHKEHVSDNERRLGAGGAGSRETLVGNGRDDPSDALDRRVDSKAAPCTRRPGAEPRDRTIRAARRV